MNTGQLEELLDIVQTELNNLRASCAFLAKFVAYRDSPAGAVVPLPEVSIRLGDTERGVALDLPMGEGFCAHQFDQLFEQLGRAFQDAIVSFSQAINRLLGALVRFAPKQGTDAAPPTPAVEQQPQ